MTFTVINLVEWGFQNYLSITQKSPFVSHKWFLNNNDLVKCRYPQTTTIITELWNRLWMAAVRSCDTRWCARPSSQSASVRNQRRLSGKTISRRKTGKLPHRYYTHVDETESRRARYNEKSSGGLVVCTRIEAAVEAAGYLYMNYGNFPWRETLSWWRATEWWNCKVFCSEKRAK